MSFTVKITESDFGLEKLSASLLKFDGSSLDVGLINPSKSHPNAENVGTVFLVHEFGQGPHTEKRFLRGTMDKNDKKYGIILARILRSQLDKNRAISVRSAFLSLGPVIKKDVRDRIREIDLIDTRTLLNSIDFRVRKR